MNRPEDAPTEPVLYADIATALAEAVPPLPADAPMLRRVKQRLMHRVAQDQWSRHRTIDADEGQWQPLGPGLTMKMLHREGGIASYLVRLAPGAVLAAHRHPIDEECVVLEGKLQIGERTVGAGGFHLGVRDVLHAPIVSEGGALIFLRGAAPQRELLV